MAHDNLLALAHSILRHAPSDEGEFILPVQDDATTKALAELPIQLREKMALLLDDIRALVPSDFSTTCEFHKDGMSLLFEYNDGNLNSFGGAAPLFISRKSMRNRLRSMPWDEMRKEHFEKCDFFDALASEAEDRPANIPSSLEAAKVYADQLDKVFETLSTAKRPIPFVMVHAREGDGVVDVVDYPSRSALVHTMADLMTTQHEILAVVENGERWSFDAIEEAKREAVSYLGPISRAKAERRYPMHYENLSR